MEWINKYGGDVPIMSWCGEVEKDALTQAKNLASHPAIFHHVALMPDCHVGYGMPIGGVVACEDVVIPNAVGVDIGCGMCAVSTDIPHADVDRGMIERILHGTRRGVPLGEGRSHRDAQEWDGFLAFENEARGTLRDRRCSVGAGDSAPPGGGWYGGRSLELDRRNLGSLGGGNHFIELQAGDDGRLWLMIHTGSRNLGYRVAAHYHKLAQGYCREHGLEIPVADLAYLPASSESGREYIRSMEFALAYARENRRRIMDVFRRAVEHEAGRVAFGEEINIHHNYAALEEHFGAKVWVHRKGATSARAGQQGIIPGSMGTPSFIVEGLGNADSFCSCSHGAGRVMGRKEACRRLTREDCDRAMGDVVFDGWKEVRSRRGRCKKERLLNFEEAPLAYKDIEKVLSSQLDLVKILVKLTPLGVLKG